MFYRYEHYMSISHIVLIVNMVHWLEVRDKSIPKIIDNKQDLVSSWCNG